MPAKKNKKPRRIVIDLLDTTDEDDEVVSFGDEVSHNNKKTTVTASAPTQATQQAAVAEKPSSMSCWTFPKRRRSRPTESSTQEAHADPTTLLPSLSSSTTASTSSKKKRKIQAAAVASKTTASEPSQHASTATSSQLWVDRYAPKCSDDLAVAPKKVSQIRKWLVSQQQQQTTSSKKLLVLAGRPGIGKSTAVRVLCRELGIYLYEYNESFYFYNSSRHRKSQSSTASSWRENYSQPSPSESLLQQQSPLQQFEDFLQPLVTKGGGASATSMRLETTSTTTTTMDPQSSNMSCTDDATTNYTQSMVLLEELPNLHTAQQRARFQELFGRYLTTASAAPVIFILSTSQRTDDDRNSRGIANDLQQWIPEELITSTGLVDIMTVNPVTTAKMKKHLHQIQTLRRQEQQAEDERQMNGGSLLASLKKSKKKKKSAAATPVETAYYQDLHDRSQGDMRFAVTTMQYEQQHLLEETKPASTSSSRPNVASNGDDKSSSSQFRTEQPSLGQQRHRDIPLSMFQSLGKLLYAKRMEPPPEPAPWTTARSLWDDGRPPLRFNPEQVVLDFCHVDIGTLLHFLEFHSLDFFTDVTELSQAWELFSDTAVMLDASFGTSSSCASLVPHQGYAASVMSRAIAACNRHATASKYRKLYAPKSFEVIQKRRDNQFHMEQLHRRLVHVSLSSSSNDSYESTPYLLPPGSSSCPRSFAMDSLPYARKILQVQPDTTCAGILNNMHSFIGQNSSNNNGRAASFTAAKDDELDEQQQQLLLEDDITEVEDTVGSAVSVGGSSRSRFLSSYGL